jgi:dTDP-4-dehydrorhamnose reductase
MKVLVVGGSGLTGFKLASLAKDEFEVYATYNARTVELEDCTFVQLDKRDRAATFGLMKKLEPEVVVDTAALHNVNYCETHPDAAWRVNVMGTGHVAEACAAVGARLIFVSTDYVFDGKNGFYTEEDAPNPLNVYAETKLEGERVVAKRCGDYAVARTSVIYGWNPSELAGLKSSSGKSVNFVIWALRKLRNGEAISIVIDQFSSPTLADSLAEALLALCESEKQGIFHTAGKSCLNRFDFTKKIATVFGLDASLIKPVTSDLFRQVAERPMKSCLDVTKAERELGIAFLTAEDGLKRMQRQSNVEDKR